MHIVITGGAGFIGSHLGDVLLAHGHRVTAIDDLSKGAMANVEHNLQNPKFRFIKLDVRSRAELERVCTGCDAIAHLAAAKIPRYGSAYDTLTVNLDGTRSVLEVARTHGAKFVLASTSDVYGKKTDFPFAEDGDLVLGTSTSRRWAYAATKLIDEHLAYAYQDEYQLRIAILRYFGCYGERQYMNWWGGPQGVFLQAIDRNEPVEIHGDGEQTRCFMHVTDLAEATARAVEREKVNGEIVNIGTQEEVSIIGLARLMHETSGSPNELKVNWVPYSALSKNYQDVRRRIPDLGKMERLLDFKPTISLTEGNKRLWQWYRASKPA